MMKKYFQISFYVSLLTALLTAGVLLYIGLKHNAQEEFYSAESGQIEFYYITLVFLSWAIPVFIGCIITRYLVFCLYRWAVRVSNWIAAK